MSRRSGSAEEPKKDKKDKSWTEKLEETTFGEFWGGDVYRQGKQIEKLTAELEEIKKSKKRALKRQEGETGEDISTDYEEGEDEDSENEDDYENGVEPRRGNRRGGKRRNNKNGGNDDLDDNNSESRFVPKDGSKRSKENTEKKSLKTDTEIRAELEKDQTLADSLFQKENDILPAFEFGPEKIPDNPADSNKFVSEYATKLTEKLSPLITPEMEKKYKGKGLIENILPDVLKNYDDKTIKGLILYSKVYGLLKLASNKFQTDYKYITDLKNVNGTNYSGKLEFKLSKNGTEAPKFELIKPLPDNFEKDYEAVKEKGDKEKGQTAAVEAGVDPKADAEAEALKNSPFGKLFGFFLSFKTPLNDANGNPVLDSNKQPVMKDGFYKIAAGVGIVGMLGRAVAGLFGFEAYKGEWKGFADSAPDFLKPFVKQAEGYSTKRLEALEKDKVNAKGKSAEDFIKLIKDEKGLTVGTEGLTLGEKIDFASFKQGGVDYIEVKVPDDNIVDFGTIGKAGVKHISVLENGKYVELNPDGVHSLNRGTYKITGDIPEGTKFPPKTVISVSKTPKTGVPPEKASTAKA